VSDTPRVDEYIRAYNEKEKWARDMSPVELAEQLERENAALREDNLKAHQMACAAGLDRDRLRDELAALRKHLAEMRSMFHDMADRFGCPEFKTCLFDDFMRMKRELLARELLRETAYPARAKEGGAS
jgi:hypothetical protein